MWNEPLDRAAPRFVFCPGGELHSDGRRGRCPARSPSVVPLAAHSFFFVPPPFLFIFFLVAAENGESPVREIGGGGGYWCGEIGGGGASKMFCSVCHSYCENDDHLQQTSQASLWYIFSISSTFSLFMFLQTCFTFFLSFPNTFFTLFFLLPFVSMC